MADSMQFDLVSPERRLASLAVREVQIPGAEGDLTAMPDHAPVITTLRPGILRARGAEGETAYVVSGGFAEISAAATTVLAERAVPLDEARGAFLDNLLSEATAAAEQAPPESREVADKLVADVEALRVAVGAQI